MPKTFVGHSLLSVAGMFALLTSTAIAQQEFFDDFRYSSSTDAALKQFGWQVRASGVGPGCTGATWERSLIEFWDNAEVPGDKVMGLTAYTDGAADGSGTGQCQINTAHSRFKNGTYAARIQFTRAPVLTSPSEPSVQAFFTYSSHTDPCAESFSECDYEFVPMPGTFSHAQAGLWVSTHETSCQDPLSTRWGDTAEVWHVCMIRVHDTSVEYLVDGMPVSPHTGAYTPESVMQIMFNHWFYCSLLVPRTPLGYSFAVDWVYFSDAEWLSDTDVVSRISALRDLGQSRADTVSLRAKLTASDGHEQVVAQFGTSVAVSNSTAWIGSVFDDARGPDAGAVYIVQRALGQWTEDIKLMPSDLAAGDFFGVAVSVSGDLAVVGAGRADTPAGLNAGAAYVYQKPGGSWTQIAKLTPTDGQPEDEFGWAVSADRDLIVVGAHWDDDRGSNAGAAYVFQLVSGAWLQVAKLTASDGKAGDYFGDSLTVNDGTVVVGAVFHDTAAGADAGAAYVFQQVSGVWQQVAILTASDGAAGDHFGQSPSIDGNTLMIGAVYDDDQGANAGSVFVFTNTGTLWTQSAKLLAPDGSPGDSFGWSVSTCCGTAVVGAVYDDDRGTDSGSAYVFMNTGGTWMLTSKLVAPDGAANDLAGLDVSTSCGIVLIGACYDDDRGLNAGATYVYDVSRRCLADLTSDGIVDFSDYLEFLNLYDAHMPTADFNCDGIVDFSDYLEFLNHYDAGC